MAIHKPFTKVFEGVASRHQMFELFNVPAETHQDRVTGANYVGRWFEIQQAEFDSMLDLMPPLFQRPGMFAMSELMAGTVGSVFFEIVIFGQTRCFHGYCDLGDPRSPDAMRYAIITHETGPAASAP